MGKKRASQTWFTSDPHFGHDNVINFCNRPFKDMHEMMEKMRIKWNAKVSPEDQVIFVGDIFFHLNKLEAKAYLDSLNGRKILVRGNHDRTPREMNAMGFEFVCEEMVLVIANERVTISHYPFRAPEYVYLYHNIKNKIYKFLGLKGTWALDRKFYTRRPENKGQFLIHGHTHSKRKRFKFVKTWLDRLFFNGKLRHRQIHVGVDAWGFEPIPIGEIGNIITTIKGEEDGRAGKTVTPKQRKRNE